MQDIIPAKSRSLTRAQFEDLADVPPEEEWLENITSEKTRRAYRVDVREVISYAGLKSYNELRTVARSHVIGWRKDMERRKLKPASIRRKLAALSSLFDYLCERNAVWVRGSVGQFVSNRGSCRRDSGGTSSLSQSEESSRRQRTPSGASTRSMAPPSS
jgi:hypothetical protein